MTWWISICFLKSIIWYHFGTYQLVAQNLENGKFASKSLSLSYNIAVLFYFIIFVGCHISFPYLVFASLLYINQALYENQRRKIYIFLHFKRFSSLNFSIIGWWEQERAVRLTAGDQGTTYHDSLDFGARTKSSWRI